MTEVKAKVGGPTVLRAAKAEGPTAILANSALGFFGAAAAPAAKLGDGYLLTFDIELKSNLPLHKQITCTLYKKSIKHHKYKKIASRIFLVKQARENGVLNNEMWGGVFTGIIFPTYKQIGDFVGETLPSLVWEDSYKSVNIDDLKYPLVARY
jgi:hypothetical protein